MNITVKVSSARIRELLESAGCGYWSDVREFRLRKTLGFTLLETGDKKPKTHRVTPAMVRRGLILMANAESDEGGHHFHAVLDPMRSDMYTGDAVIQFAVFGELKYG